jgi:hypothetical protein
MDRLFMVGKLGDKLERSLLEEWFQDLEQEHLVLEKNVWRGLYILFGEVPLVWVDFESLLVEVHSVGVDQSDDFGILIERVLDRLAAPVGPCSVRDGVVAWKCLVPPTESTPPAL